MRCNAAHVRPGLPQTIKRSNANERTALQHAAYLKVILFGIEWSLHRHSLDEPERSGRGLGKRKPHCGQPSRLVEHKSRLTAR